jgi:MFS family permease
VSFGTGDGEISQPANSNSLIRMLVNNHVYRLFWLGIGVSNIGTWMQMIAQDWLVLVVLEAGPAALGVTVALQLVPTLFASPLGGLLADRLSKRRLLMITNTFGGLCALTLGLLVLSGRVEVWHVYVMAFLLGSVRALDSPPRLAYASELVAHVDVARAVALEQSLVQRRSPHGTGSGWGVDWRFRRRDRCSSSTRCHI